MRKLQAPQWSCESQSPAAFLQGSWVLLPGPGAAILSRDQQPECLRAGGSKALKGEPPPGRLLPPPRILTVALRASCLGMEHLQLPPLSLTLCLISSPNEELTPS